MGAIPPTMANIVVVNQVIANPLRYHLSMTSVIRELLLLLLLLGDGTCYQRAAADAAAAAAAAASVKINEKINEKASLDLFWSLFIKVSINLLGCI